MAKAPLAFAAYEIYTLRSRSKLHCSPVRGQVTMSYAFCFIARRAWKSTVHASAGAGADQNGCGLTLYE